MRALHVHVGLFLAVLALALPSGRRTRPPVSTQATGPRVGLVFDVGGLGDKSFNDAAYAGLLRGEKELGARVEMLEPSGAEDREAALRLFAARGFDLVIGVGFIFSRDVDAVARAYPSVRFSCVDYTPPPDGGAIPPNVTGLAYREHEGAFLVGAAAALRSKAGHVGFVGGMDIPLIHKFDAGYRAGVAAVCPTCTVHRAYAGTTPEAFRDPAKGKTIALSQIAAQVDVIFHASGSTGHGVFEAVKQHPGVLAIGVDVDQWDEAPGAVLTSMTKQADVAVFEAIRKARDGSLASGLAVFGLAEGGVDWVHTGPHAALLPAPLVARVEALRAEIVAGARVVPSE